MTEEQFSSLIHGLTLMYKRQERIEDILIRISSQLEKQIEQSGSNTIDVESAISDLKEEVTKIVNLNS